MRIFLKITQWIIVIVLFVSTLIFTNKESQRQFISLHKIDVVSSSNRFIDESFVLESIQNNNINFDSILLCQFQLDTLEVFLQENPLIENVEIFTNQKGDLSINIKPRKAIVRIISDTINYYLDKDAVKMPPKYTERVLVATGAIREKDHKALVEFVGVINNSLFWKSQITQLYFFNDEVMLIPRVGDQKIYFGMLDNIQKKLDNLYHFYSQAMRIKGWQYYTDISLKYENQIVCTKNK